MIDKLKEVEKLLRECIYETEVTSIVMPLLMEVKIKVSGLIRDREG